MVYTITVTDSIGNPVSGATVGGDDNLQIASYTTSPNTTDANGHINYTTTVPNEKPNGTYNITFVATRPGYNTSSTVTRQVQVLHITTSFWGTVTDSSSGSPISGATVNWGTTYSTTTAANGIYSINNITCGTATLTVSKNGYQTYSQSYTPTCNASSLKSVSMTPGLSGTVSRNVEGGAYPVSIQQYGALPGIINPNQRTWLVIHGRGSSRNASNIAALAQALASKRPTDQVLTLDWSWAASVGVLGDLDYLGADAIVNVATWAVLALQNYGFTGGKLNLVGHSWGGCVAAEMAQRTSTQINTIIALDPAENAPVSPPIYDTEATSVDFSKARYSWAFHSSLDGSAITPTRANEAIIVDTGLDLIDGSAHNIVVNLVANMLGASDAISGNFQLDRLLNYQAGPWLPDQFHAHFSEGIWEDPVGGYEADLMTTVGGETPYSLTYYSKTTGQEVTDYVTFVPMRIISLGGNLTFGSVAVDSSPQSTLTIYNTGNSTMAVSGISYPSGFSGNWSGTIGAGSSRAVTVTFCPTSAMSYGGTVTVNSDETGGVNTIAASGAGTVTATRTISVNGNLAFGGVPVGSSAQSTLTIYNNGNSTLTVSSISYPSGFSGNWSGTIAAGGSQPVTVTFSPTSTISYGGTVTVNSDYTGGVNTIAASGTGTPTPTRIISLSGNLAFGSVTVGSTAQTTLTIYNTGNSTLTVSSISYPSGFSGNWSGTIGAGGSQPVTVTFSPTSTIGYGGTVTVGSDCTSGVNTIAASGTGTPLPTRIISLSGNLAFGSVTVGSTAQTTLAINNTGNSTMTVSSISYPSGFSGNWSGTIGAGGSQPVTVTFSPTSTSSYGGTVTVNSDYTSGVNTIAASGTGTPTPTRIISLSGNLAFGSVAVGSTAQTTLTIYNTGNSTMTVTSISYPSGFSGNWSGTIDAGGSQPVTVTFSPTSTISYGGTVAVNSDYTSGVNTIGASGTGAPQPTRIIALSGNLAFANVTVGSSEQATLTIANTGNSTLTVSGIGYPAGFSGDWSSGTIPAGSSQPVTVTFAPTATTGYGGNITVTSDATSGINTIAASGTGTPQPTRIIALSANLSFGNVTVGSSAQATLTIASTGNSTLTVSGIGYPAGFSGNWSSGTIPAGSSQPVTVTFAPTVAAGYGGNIAVSSDATSGNNTIPASGTGTPPASPSMSVSYGGTAIPNGDQSPSAAKGTDFGTALPAMGSSPRVFTITNTGNGVLNLSGTHPVQFTGNNASDFGVMAQPSTPVAANGGTTTFWLMFWPAPGLPSVRTALVTIASDDPNNNQYTFMVQGTVGLQIWGSVHTSAGAPVSGVVMSGLPGSPSTDATGHYSGVVNYGWLGSVTPTLAGYSFAPASSNYSGITTDQGEQDYVGTPPINGTASFVGTDAATQGNWEGKYGAEGFVVVDDATNYPSYATVSPAGELDYPWLSPTADPRCLQEAAVPSQRVAACWYSATSFTINVAVQGGRATRLALYCLDWDSKGRVQQVDLLDGVSGAVLDSQMLSNFTNGEYLVWDVTGSVRVRVTSLVNNAVVSGVFFDAVGAARFVGVDGATQGNWQGKYGAEGYMVVGDATNYPSYATLSPVGQSDWVWLPPQASNDVRCLQKVTVPGDRVAACWYAESSFTMDMAVGLGRATRLALYCVDWDQKGRVQQVDLLDGVTGAVLDSQTLSNFTNGEYLVWDVRGLVQVRVTPLVNNAVVSGVFFDVGANVRFVGVDGATQGDWQGKYGAEGYVVVNDAANYPSYEAVLPAGQSDWVWKWQASNDVRCLQKVTVPGDRVAACWYAQSSFTMDVPVGLGRATRLALYCLDFDY